MSSSSPMEAQEDCATLHQRFLFLDNDFTCGIFKIQNNHFNSSASQYLYIVLNNIGDLCLIRDDDAMKSDVHLTRYVPHSYRLHVKNLLKFRNKFSCKPYCCETFHGNNTYFGTLESLWSTESNVKSSDTRVHIVNNTQNSLLIVDNILEKIIYRTSVLYPKENVTCRGDCFNPPNHCMMSFVWPISRAPKDVVGLLLAMIATPSLTACETANPHLIVHTTFPSFNEIGAKSVDTSLSYFQEIVPELSLLIDSGKYPTCSASLYEYEDGVYYVYTNTQNKNFHASNLSTSCHALEKDNNCKSALFDAINTSTYLSSCVECWIDHDELNDFSNNVSTEKIIMLKGEVFNYKCHNVELNVGSVHMSLLNSIVGDVNETNPASIDGIGWIYFHKTTALKLLLFREQLLPSFVSSHISTPRLSNQMGITVSPDSCDKYVNTGSTYAIQSTKHQTNVINTTRNPANLIDIYSYGKNNRKNQKSREYETLLSGVDSNISFEKHKVSSTPIRESTRCSDYSLTVYMNGNIHGIFNDFTVIDLFADTQVARIITATGVVETISVSRYLSDTFASSFGYDDSIAQKLKLMMWFKRYTDMDYTSRDRIIQQSFDLKRSAALEILKNDMMITLQKFDDTSS